MASVAELATLSFFSAIKQFASRFGASTKSEACCIKEMRTDGAVSTVP